ncbi:MAG: tetratricopeptide repeat protein [Treponema sp.]|nr:tetratricopeptide repeat protein [Treponema sp.]
MSEKNEKTTSSEKLNSFIEKNRVCLFTVLGVLVVAVICYTIVLSVSSKSKEKALSQIDEITYVLTKDSAGLEDAELEAKRAVALEAVTPFLNKGGVAGVRANMLAADLAFQAKDFAKAFDYYAAAASKSKKSYTAPLAYYNMGVCAEQLGNAEDAIANYKKASDSEGFVLKSHALFSLGRAYESKNDNEKAAEAYNSIINGSPDDIWANVAKTRLLDMKAKGNIQ